MRMASDKRMLLQVAEDLARLARSIDAVADTLRNGAEAKPPEAAGTKPKENAKPITLEQVRSVLAEKSRDGHTDKVRGLLEKHGAAKLSEIDPAKYAALLADAKELGNG
jgi:hypothetical protein